MHADLILTREEVRQLDQMAISQLSINSLVLMENAGRGAAESIVQKMSAARHGTTNPFPSKVLILCGKGNNGGDGLVIIRHLAILGIPAQAVVFAHESELSADARANWQIANSLSLSVATLSSTDKDLQQQEGAALLEKTLASLSPHDWIIDALLGTGSTTSPRGLLATVIEAINRTSHTIVALDLPSGLDADSGQPLLPTVQSHYCLTFAAMKPGLVPPQPYISLGTEIISIGLPDEFVQQAKRSAKS